jgi:hypothetical protein
VDGILGQVAGPVPSATPCSYRWKPRKARILLVGGPFRSLNSDRRFCSSHILPSGNRLAMSHAMGTGVRLRRIDLTSFRSHRSRSRPWRAYRAGQKQKLRHHGRRMRSCADPHAESQGLSQVHRDRGRTSRLHDHIQHRRRFDSGCAFAVRVFPRGQPGGTAMRWQI